MLLIETCPVHAPVFQVALHALGQTLQTCSSQEAALAMLVQHDFSAIVLDITMQTTARAIRALPGCESTPLIFISTLIAPDAHLEEACRLTAVDVMSTPLVPTLLKTRLALFVQLHQQRQALHGLHSMERELARRLEAETLSEQLRASQERVRLATESGGLGVWMWDVAGDKVTWEHAWLYDLFGLPPHDEPLNAARFASEFLHPDDQASFSKAVLACLQGSEKFSFVGRFFRQPNREIRWLEFNGALQPGNAGAPPWLLGTASDITDKRRTAEELRLQDERYRMLFESMDEGVCLIELLFDEAGTAVDYRFIETNPAFERHTGMRHVTGRTMRELVPDHDSHWFEIYGRVVLTGEPVRFTSEAKAMSRWFDVYATPFDGRDSRKLAVLFNDITLRTRHEEDLRRMAAELAESNRRKTEFLATLAHELRNPLAPIRNGLQILRSASDWSATAPVHNMIERQVDHLVHLVDDLLDIARITHGHVHLKKQRVSLHSVMTSAVESSAPLMTESGHQLHVQWPDASWQLEVDPIRISQSLGNLLNNAAKYTPPSGTIELTASREGDDVVIAVKDSGMGISAESMSSVFDMFSQIAPNVAQGGLGIGLSVVHGLIAMHGGTVSVVSPGADQGSTFSIRLALAEPQVNLQTDSLLPLPLAGHSPAARAVAGSPGLRVLVVDDNHDAADTLAILLELDGHTALVAHDGEQALVMAPEFHPDVVFLDIGMPLMNGYEVAQAMRKVPQLQGVVLAALTGWGTEADRALSKAAGFDHHLTKPANLSQIEAVLQSLHQPA